MLDVLAYLNKLNHSVDGLRVPYDTFHITELSEFMDVRVDYVYWLSDAGVSSCIFSFLVFKIILLLFLTIWKYGTTG